MNRQVSEDKTLGGRFIRSKEEILFKLTGTEMPNFWENVTARFTLDGTKATIQTLDETYLLMLDSNLDGDQYLKHAKIPFLKGKQVKQFHRGEEHQLFCNYDPVAANI